MKRKVLLIAAAVIILAIALVGGTLAWFTDTDETTNVFTVGSIDIVQNEVFDEDAAMLLPVVGDDPTDSGDNYIEKKVTVENIGKNAAYVQTYVAVPTVLDDNGVLKLYDINASANGWTKMDGDENTDGVQPIATGIAVNGEIIPYNVYLYRYDSVLEKGNETDECLEYVYIDPSIDLNVYDFEGNDGVNDTAYFVLADGSEIDGFNAAGNLNVYVATQAVQTVGFDSAESAFDVSFPSHPWED